ncbi:hypothetical protein ACN28E_07280 [Archangium lansingense]|uniref:hypothetical protein n=1 Tax=Archangium lansingense TaxID=2995310 RepID=UPI003B760D44
MSSPASASSRRTVLALTAPWRMRPWATSAHHEGGRGAGVLAPHVEQQLARRLVQRPGQPAVFARPGHQGREASALPAVVPALQRGHAEAAQHLRVGGTEALLAELHERRAQLSAGEGAVYQRANHLAAEDGDGLAMVSGNELLHTCLLPARDGMS